MRMLLAALLLTAFSKPTLAQTFADKLGPAVGAAIPSFQATDQSGNLRQLKSIAGPKGTILLFIRSADW